MAATSDHVDVEVRAKPQQMMVATESFSCEVEGRVETIIKGKTRVDAAHPIARQNPQYFTPVEAHYGVEQMTAEPGVPRGVRF